MDMSDDFLRKLMKHIKEEHAKNMLKQWFHLEKGWSSGIADDNYEESYKSQLCDLGYLEKGNLREGGEKSYRITAQGLKFTEESKQEKKYDVFISYAQKDSEQKASQIESELKNRGYNVWRDKNALKPGDKQLSEITKAIAESQITAYLMSPEADQSRYCALELGAAAQEQLYHSSTTLAPVRITEYISTNFPLGSDVNYADCRDENFNEGIDKIIQAIRKCNEN